jgi:ketosteroid isomerase-like protein
VFVRTSGTARQSGAEVEIPAAHVLALEDGRVTRTEVFLDRQEALKAVNVMKKGPPR